MYKINLRSLSLNLILNVMLHALVQFFDLTFVMKNKKNFANAKQR